MDDYESNLNSQVSETIDLRQYLWLLGRWAWLIALLTVLAAGAGYLFSSLQTPIYQSSTTVMVNQGSSRQVIDSSMIYVNEQLSETYSKMIVAQPVLDETAKRLKLPEIKGIITAKPINNTQLMEISVTDTDPYRASVIANELVMVFSQQINDMQASRYKASKENLQNQMTNVEAQIKDTGDILARSTDIAEKDRLDTRLTQYQTIYASLLSSFEQIRLAESETQTNLLQVSPAIPNLIPISPQIARSAALAGVVGLMLAIGLIFAIEFFDDTIKDPDKLAQQTGLPILATIGAHVSVDGLPITMTSPRSPVSEAFRSLRTNVQYTGVDEPLRRIMVTSPTPEDGKTTVTSNLAVVMAQGGMRVTVIDADLRRPRIHQRFGLPNKVGLSSMFVSPEVNLNGGLQKTNTDGLRVISSGDTPPNPSELLGSKRMKDILKEVDSQSDVVILDTPPVLSVTDACVLASIVNGVLLVIKPGVTKQAAFIQAVEQLRQVNARVLGIVLNDINLKNSKYYYYKNYYNNRYTYYYAETPDGKVKKKRKLGKNEVISPADSITPLQRENESMIEDDAD